MRKPSVACLLLLMASAGVLPALCAPAAAAQPQIIRLEPKQMAGIEQGKAVVVKGRASPDAHRFIVDKLTYMMPIAVAVRPVNKGDEIGLKITKYAWNQPLRAGETRGDMLRYAFRTEGEFQVAVDAKTPGTPYRLLVWVGDETKPVFAPVVVKASEYQDAAERDTGSAVLWIIAGALIAIVALLCVLVLRRKTP